LSILCESFNRLPSEVLKEVDEAPEGLLEEIVEARAYAQIVQTMKDHPTDVPDSELGRLAQEIEFDLVREARDAASR